MAIHTARHVPRTNTKFMKRILSARYGKSDTHAWLLLPKGMEPVAGHLAAYAAAVRAQARAIQAMGPHLNSLIKRDKDNGPSLEAYAAVMTEIGAFEGRFFYEALYTCHQRWARKKARGTKKARRR